MSFFKVVLERESRLSLLLSRFHSYIYRLCACNKFALDALNHKLGQSCRFFRGNIQPVDNGSLLTWLERDFPHIIDLFPHRDLFWLRAWRSDRIRKRLMKIEMVCRIPVILSLIHISEPTRLRRI